MCGSEFVSSLFRLLLFRFGIKIWWSFCNCLVIFSCIWRPSLVLFILFTPFIRNWIVCVWAVWSRLTWTDLLTFSQFFFTLTFFLGVVRCFSYFSWIGVCMRSLSRNKLRSLSSSGNFWSFTFLMSNVHILVMNCLRSIRMILFSSLTDCWE